MWGRGMNVDIVLRHQVDRLVSGGRSSDVEETLNELLVEFLRCKGFIKSEALASAWLSTPRHLFIPDCDLRHAYTDRAVATVCDGDGWFESSCSTPSIVCTMLEALQLSDAKRILELGTGTGFTAALMARMAPDADIVSLEVLEQVAEEARVRLEGMGLSRVDVRAADGSGTTAGPGPYDRIVLACGASEIPQHLVELLSDGGLMVIPIAGCVFVFEKQGSRLVGQPVIPAAFIAYADNGPQAVWRQDGDLSVLWPAGIDFETAALGDADTVSPGPVVASSQIALWMLWTALTFPDRALTLAHRDGGWGFGLHDPDTGSTVFCRMEEELTFRHYGERMVHTHFESWGDLGLSDEFLALGETLSEIGWPPFDRLLIEVSAAGCGAEVLDSCAEFRVGAHLWRFAVSEFEVVSGELGPLAEQP